MLKQTMEKQFFFDESLNLLQYNALLLRSPISPEYEQCG